MDTLYKQYIIDHYKSPRNYGRIVGADSTVMVENLSCGDKIELFLKFDDNGSIREVKFEASGCAICIATMSMLSERVIGLNKDQVKKISKESVLNLTGLSELSGRVKCGLIAWDAVNASINVIFLDIETQNDWTGGDFFKIEEMKISYVGVIDDVTNKEMDFWENDIEELGQVLRSSDKIVHYNGFTFDMPVIANYLDSSILGLPQIDLMHAAYKCIGFRPKLDDLATATLGYGKIGKGSDAVKYWASGDLESLKKYCLQDVRVTMELYKFGLKNGFIRYFDRNGFLRDAKIDWSVGERGTSAKSDDDITISMF